MSSLVVSSIANASGQAFAVPNGISGNIKATTGNLIIGTAGKGIDFDPAGSGAAANLLDDYEEGTWTPSLASGTSGSITTTDRAGRYTKIGRVVFVEGYANIASVSSPVGDLRISGLPFNIQNAAPGAGSTHVYGFLNSPAVTAIQVFMQGGQAYAVIRGFMNGAQVSGYAANAQSGAGLQFSLVYSV